MKRYREHFFLATKVDQVSYKEAKEQLYRSLISAPRPTMIKTCCKYTILLMWYSENWQWDLKVHSNS